MNTMLYKATLMWLLSIITSIFGLTLLGFLQTMNLICWYSSVGMTRHELGGLTVSLFFLMLWIGKLALKALK